MQHSKWRLGYRGLIPKVRLLTLYQDSLISKATLVSLGIKADSRITFSLLLIRTAVKLQASIYAAYT